MIQSSPERAMICTVWMLGNGRDRAEGGTPLAPLLAQTVEGAGAAGVKSEAPLAG